MDPKRPSAWRHYSSAWLTLFSGLLLSGLLYWQLDREGARVDDARFRLESHLATQMLESTMERYEERLARLADHAAAFDLLPDRVWSFRSGKVTDFSYNLLSVMYALYCPKVMAEDFERHVENGRKQRGKDYGFETEQRTNRDLALPVWHQYARSGFPRIPSGTDLAMPTPDRPSLRPGLSRVLGWISPDPVQVGRTDGTNETGFWFIIPVFGHNQVNFRAPKPTNRIVQAEDAKEEQRAFYESAAKGVLAAFVSTDRLIDLAYNQPRVSNHVYVRLYASKTPDPQRRFQSRVPAPATPRHQQTKVMAWYGRRWLIETLSTPAFEAASPRHRAMLAGGAGMGLSVLATALVTVGVRARLRQEGLLREVTEARDALVAVEKERERMGYDLHDGAIQSLYAIQLGLSRTAEIIKPAQPETALRLSETREQVNEVIGDLRQFIHSAAASSTSPSTPQLEHVLSSMIQWLRPTTTAQLTLEAQPRISEQVTPRQAVALTQVARTALANALRHSQATHICLRLSGGPQAIRLEVTDNGVGFDPDRKEEGGLGLHTMRTRALEANGRLSIETKPGGGTRVTVTLPLNPAPPAT